MLNPVNNYAGGGLRPVMDSNGELTDVVTLAAGKSFPKGTVLGQVLGSGTAVNEVQTITPTGTISGGTFRIVYDGETTTPLDFDASNAEILAALEALPSIGTGNVTVAGGVINTTAVTLTFAGAGTTAGKHHPLVSIINSLTGTTPVLTPTLTTLGVPAAGYWDAYDDAASSPVAGLAIARRVLTYDTRTDGWGRHYQGLSKNGGDNGSYLMYAPCFIAGTFRTSELVGLDANGVADLGRLISGTLATLSATTTLLRIG